MLKSWPNRSSISQQLTQVWGVSKNVTVSSLTFIILEESYLDSMKERLISIRNHFHISYIRQNVR